MFNKENENEIIFSCPSCLKVAVQICTTCHKPYPNFKYFCFHPKICKSCCIKYQNSQIKRKEQRKTIAESKSKLKKRVKSKRQKSKNAS
jgi:hypothetical protein